MNSQIIGFGLMFLKVCEYVNSKVKRLRIIPMYLQFVNLSYLTYK